MTAIRTRTRPRSRVNHPLSFVSSVLKVFRKGRTELSHCHMRLWHARTPVTGNCQAAYVLHGRKQPSEVIERTRRVAAESASISRQGLIGEEENHPWTRRNSMS